MRLEPRKTAFEHPVEAVELGRSSAARRADHIDVAEPPEQHQVAWIDRHPEPQDVAAGGHKAGRNDIAAIDDGGGRKHDDRIGAGSTACAGSPRRRVLLVLDDSTGPSRLPNVSSRTAMACSRLASTLAFVAGSRVRISPAVLARSGATRSNPAGVRASASARATSFGQRKRDDLDRRYHLFLAHALEGRRRGDRQAFIDHVERVHARAVDLHQTSRVGEEVRPAREWCRAVRILAAGRACDAPRRLVLTDVAGFELRRDDVGEPGRLEAPQLRGRQFASLLDAAAGGADGMRRIAPWPRRQECVRISSVWSCRRLAAWCQRR